MAPLLAAALKIIAPIVVREAVKKAADKVVTTEGREEMKDVAVGSAKSKTMWLGLIVGILGVLETQQGLVTSLVGQENLGIVMSVVGGLTMVLRAVTNKPVAEKA